MSNKLPAIQFYFSDWMTDVNLRRCSDATRGLWIDILSFLHGSEEEYGVLRWTLKEIHHTTKVPMKNLNELISNKVLKGSDNGILEDFVYVPRSGRKDGKPVILIPKTSTPIYFSARLVRDNYIRKNRGKETQFTSEYNPKNATFNTSPIPPIGELKSDGSTSSSSSSNNNISIAREGENFKYENEEAVQELCEWFSINQISNPNLFMKFSDFVEIIHNQGKLDYFRNQFQAYRQIHKKVDPKYHCSPQNFMGYLPDRGDGKWNSENWEHKLKLQTQQQNSAKDGITKQTTDTAARKDYSF